MHKLLAATTLAISFAFASAANAQPVGLGTSPQGTLTYAVGAAVAKTLTEAGHIQARVQPSSGTGARWSIQARSISASPTRSSFTTRSTESARSTSGRIRTCAPSPLFSRSRSACSCARIRRSRPSPT